MNKRDFVDVVATKTAMTKADVQKVVDAAINTLLAYVKHEFVRVEPLGTFRVKTRAARTGRNPITNKPVNIPEKTTIVFKPSKAIKL